MLELLSGFLILNIDQWEGVVVDESFPADIILTDEAKKFKQSCLTPPYTQASWLPTASDYCSLDGRFPL